MTRRFRDVDASTSEAARLHRKQPTPTEEILWQALRGRQLAGLKFRRQQPLSQFIVDFLCAERHLIVEVDGAIHEDQIEYDVERTAYLNSLGYQVIRFTNEQVINDLDFVLQAIRVAATPG